MACLLNGWMGAQVMQPTQQEHGRQYAGFDRNDYPGDAALNALREHFDFVGYWVTHPPGEQEDSWLGKRALLASHGFGFAVLANGRTDAEIVRATKGGRSAKAFGEADAEAAIAATRREGFAAGTVVFLDQEEGGRMLPEQAEYLFGWTERVAGSGLRAGVYLSGQPVLDDGGGEGGDAGGRTITTAEDVLEHIASGKLHPIALWVYQDGCPPSNGCSVRPPPLDASGTAGAVIWQFAQSPRRPAVTRACARTYASDGNCYAPGGRIFVDLDVGSSADPSHGR